MQQAIGYLKRKGVKIIRLDATQRAVLLYHRLGFVEECRSLRFKGRGARYVVEGVKSMEPPHLEDVFQLDIQSFGADRSRVLRRIFQAFPRLCFISPAQGKLSGYIMVRQMETGARIGPWVCRADELSRSRAGGLLQAALNATGDQIATVGVLKEVRKWAFQLG
jgi:hypothetical protein